VAESQKETPGKKKEAKKKKDTVVPADFEKTMKRLVNAVFDLQKDIEKVTSQMESVDKNIEQLRDQFQDFAEKTQKQLGVMIPAAQFKTEEEEKFSDVESDIKSLRKEVKSVAQLRDRIEERHSSGAMSKESYEEQAKKLDTRLENLQKKLAAKEQELADLSS
jgi:chromosome segregation ATPase